MEDIRLRPRAQAENRLPDCSSQLRIEFRHLTRSRKCDAIVADAEWASLGPSALLKDDLGHVV
jgi:hypothetical protein